MDCFRRVVSQESGRSNVACDDAEIGRGFRFKHIQTLPLGQRVLNAIGVLEWEQWEKLMQRNNWNLRYELSAVVLLSLAFGLVGLDRFMILPMFPAIAEEFNLSYGDLGLITGSLSLGWGIAAVFVGRLSDRIGLRPVLLTSIVVFSLLVGFSGLAVGLWSLIIMRALMGAADGAFNPAGIIATLDASKPSRRAMNIGIQQAMLPFFGLALAPIAVTHLLDYFSWRYIFVLITPFGIILALLLYFTIRSDKSGAASVAEEVAEATAPTHWLEVVRYRNIVINMMSMLCWIGCGITIAGFLPSYLVDYRHFTPAQMGTVMSTLGFGALFGAVSLSYLSDWIGRKPVILISSLCGILCIFGLINADGSVAEVAVYAFLVFFFNFAIVVITTGPSSAESVPKPLMASASGLVNSVGEIFGGGIAPIICGYIALHFGIEYMLPFGACSLALGFVIACFLKETAPRRVAKTQLAY